MLAGKKRQESGKIGEKKIEDLIKEKNPNFLKALELLGYPNTVFKNNTGFNHSTAEDLLCESNGKPFGIQSKRILNNTGTVYASKPENFGLYNKKVAEWLKLSSAGRKKQKKFKKVVISEFKRLGLMPIERAFRPTEQPIFVYNNYTVIHVFKTQDLIDYISKTMDWNHCEKPSSCLYRTKIYLYLSSSGDLQFKVDSGLYDEFIRNNPEKSYMIGDIRETPKMPFFEDDLPEEEFEDDLPEGVEPIDNNSLIELIDFFDEEEIGELSSLAIETIKNIIRMDMK